MAYDIGSLETYQIGDKDKSCETLIIEIHANSNKIDEGSRAARHYSRRNVPAIIFGIFFIIPFFAVRHTGELNHAIDKLKDRNSHLKEMFGRMGCEV